MFSRLRRYVGGILREVRARHDLRKILQRHSDYRSLRNWPRSMTQPTEYYLDCVRCFHSHGFPEILRRHRAYFQKERRGFGEDAFHVMWWMLFRETKPIHFLEIGVYRGQTLSLASMLQRMFAIEGTVLGISPFNPSGDAVSAYRSDVNYLLDTEANFSVFDLPPPELVQAFSTDQAATDRIRKQVWDIIYIDGNHDYQIAKADWDTCSGAVRQGGLIILDDASLNTNYNPPRFATAGHPGPSQVAAEVDASQFEEVLRVGHNRVFRKL